MNIFYPDRCPICGRVVTFEIKVCNDCKGRLRAVGGNTCVRCGCILKSKNDVLCKECKKEERFFDKGISAFFYNDAIKEAIINFKYHNKRELAMFFAKYMVKTMEREGFLESDMLIPIPIHKSRRVKRGYNQAEVLCKEISKLTGIPMKNDIIIREKKTEALKEQGRQERLNSLKNAFAVDNKKKDLIKGKTVIMVDDIYTTGSTMDAMGKVVLECGALKVYFITIATGAGI